MFITIKMPHTYLLNRSWCLANRAQLSLKLFLLIDFNYVLCMCDAYFKRKYGKTILIKPILTTRLPCRNKVLFSKRSNRKTEKIAAEKYCLKVLEKAFPANICKLFCRSMCLSQEYFKRKYEKKINQANLYLLFGLHKKFGFLNSSTDSSRNLFL